MLPEAKSQDLLYVNFGSYDVGVFSFPKGKLVGILLNFGTPMCPDKNGNVWVGYYRLKSMAEYTHGMGRLIETLNVPFEPDSCAVDPSSGNLAVIGRADAVAIYRRAKGTPRLYKSSYPEFCSYDDEGNLFLVNPGTGSGFHPLLFELRKGTTRPRDVSFTSSGGFGGGFPSFYPEPVQWDGHYVALDSVLHIDRYVIKDYTATFVSSTSFSDVHQIAEAWIQGSKVVVVNQFGSGGYPAVQIDKYPAGGNPVGIVNLNKIRYGSLGRILVSVAPAGLR